MQHAPPEEKRPRPIRRAMGAVGGTILAIGTAANALLSAAAMQVTDGTRVEDLAPGVPFLLQALVVLTAAAGVIRRAEAETTPTADPATVINGWLVRLREDEEQMRSAFRAGRPSDGAR